MRYSELVQKGRRSTREKSSHMTMEITPVFFRTLGFYVAPIFLVAGVSANTITVTGLILGLLASALIWSQKVFLGIVIVFLVYLLDYIDGTVARTKDEATFYGRFIDGFFGIIFHSVLRLGLSALIAEDDGLTPIVWLGIFSSVLCPMHFLFYDRYSAFVRWIKEEGHAVGTKPYLIPNAPRVMNIINDVQHILLFSLPLYYYRSDYWVWILSLYFALNIYMAFYALFSHTKSASLHFRISAKPHR